MWQRHKRKPEQKEEEHHIVYSRNQGRKPCQKKLNGQQGRAAESSWKDCQLRCHYLPGCQRRQHPRRCCCSPGRESLGHSNQHLHTLCHHPQPGNCGQGNTSYSLTPTHIPEKENHLLRLRREKSSGQLHKKYLHGFLLYNRKTKLCILILNMEKDPHTSNTPSTQVI